jgi:hypothetical protein
VEQADRAHGESDRRDPQSIRAINGGSRRPAGVGVSKPYNYFGRQEETGRENGKAKPCTGTLVVIVGIEYPQRRFSHNDLRP